MSTEVVSWWSVRRGAEHCTRGRVRSPPAKRGGKFKFLVGWFRGSIHASNETFGHRGRRARARAGVEARAIAARDADVVRARKRGDRRGAIGAKPGAGRVRENRRGRFAEAAGAGAGEETR